MEENKILNWKKFKEIYKEILQIYPFLNNLEKKAFEKKSEKIINNKSFFINDPIKTLKRLMENLNNPHANVIEWSLKKMSPKKYFEYSIDNNILYLKIPSWTTINSNNGLKFAKDLIKLCEKEIKRYKGIIIDVRNNQGGNSRIAHDFASIFFNEDITFGYLAKRYGNKIKKRPYVLEKNKKIYIDVPIVILINNLCFSSNELFIAPFKISKRATSIGERTRGGSANPISINVEFDNKNYNARIPRWRFYLKGRKRPIEKTKIEPDIIYQKKDIIEFSKKFLLKK
ncbi:MAG: S41 family peptidase [Patescibacteria group bacterium]